MFAAAAACGALGGLVKWQSNNLASSTSDLDECVDLNQIVKRQSNFQGKNSDNSGSEKQYIFFQGSLSSDASGQVKDPDTGTKYDVVIMQKRVFDLHDVTTTTELNGSTSESTKRKETASLDSGKKFFGSKIRLNGDTVSKKTNLKAASTTTTEVALDNKEMQEKVPLSHLFSSLTRTSGTNVNVNINMPSSTPQQQGEVGLHNTKRGLHNRNSPDYGGNDTSNSANGGGNRSAAITKETKELIGTRMDVSGAAVGATFTAIGEAVKDTRGQWKLAPCPNKHSAVTNQSFEEYKGNLRRDSQMADYASTGLFTVGIAVLVAAMI